MNTDFQIISKFLENFGPEIEGRSSEKLTSETESQLVALSEGTLSADERRELSVKLLRQPKAMDFLLGQLDS